VLGGFTKGSLRKALDLSIIFFRVFYLTRNTSLPGNMLLDAEHYVKNKFYHDLFLIRTDILHFPLFLLSSMYTERKIRKKIRRPSMHPFRKVELCCVSGIQKRSPNEQDTLEKKRR